MSQTTISAGGQSIGVAGQKADSGPCDIVSGFNQNAVQIPFGYGVRDGTVVGSYVLPTGFSGVLPVAGLSVFDYNHQRAGSVDAAGNQTGDLGASGLLQNAGLQVARKGRFLVPVESAITAAQVAAGHGAWCRGVATGSLTQGSWLGAQRGGAGPLGASYHVDCSKQGVFRSASYTAADGTTLVAILEVDFTNSQY